MCPLVSQRHPHYLEMKWNCYSSNENSKKKLFRLSDWFLRIKMECLKKAEHWIYTMTRAWRVHREGMTPSFLKGRSQDGVWHFWGDNFPMVLSLFCKNLWLLSLWTIFSRMSGEQTALKDRDIVSLWDRGQICFLTSMIIFPSGAKVGHVWACSPLVRVGIS